MRNIEKHDFDFHSEEEIAGNLTLENERYTLEN